VFRVHDDYVTQRAQHSRVRKRVAHLQNPGTTARRLKRLFLQLFRHTEREVTKFEKVSREKPGRTMGIDSQMVTPVVGRDQLAKVTSSLFLLDSS
jgi:hypothetical protein